MNLKQLIEKSKEYQITKEKIDSVEKGRIEFIDRFPLESINGLSLEEYAPGTSKNSFCYWLEFKDIMFGIGGGNASKFGIYKAANDGKFYSGFGGHKKALNDEESSNIFASIKEYILKSLEFTRKDQIEKIHELEAPLWNMVLQKILSIYYPDKFISVGSPDVLIECARDIGIKGVEFKSEYSIFLNYLCRQELSHQKELKDWSYTAIGSFIWDVYSRESKKNYYIIGSKYGGSSKGDIFPDMQKKSVVAVGAASDVDLTEYYLKNHSDITSFLKEKGEDKNAINTLKYFLNLKIGDSVAVKSDGSPKGEKGFLSIIGIAEVCEKGGKIYEYKPDELGHIIHVNFIKAPVYKEFDFGGYGRTIHKLSKQEHIDAIFKDYPPPAKTNLDLNTILYGPPGTGKTYRLKNEFFAKFTDEESTKTKEEFCEELARDLAWWQIISIVMIDLKKAKVQDVFEHPLLQAKARISDNKTPKNTIWSWLQRHTKSDCPNVNFTKRDNPQFFWKDEKSLWTVDEEMARVETPDFFDVLEIYHSYRPETKTEKRYVFTTFHQSYSYEDFIEGIKPRLSKLEDEIETQDVDYHIENGIFKEIAEKAKSHPEKKYAIFIDEINRGNIANIFGELITLIEEDKRIDPGNDDKGLRAVLPYSKKEFGIPKNLYIIGTMNTADRSVEALDTALRRRFSFVCVPPEPEILAEEPFACIGIELDKMLTDINSRIERLLDSDYCIGHSYLMTIENREKPLDELKTIFLNKIIPLLQEYFYGDWGKIGLVLGKDFIEKKINSVKFLATDEYEDYDEFDAKPVYHFTDPATWTLETFKNIYE